MSKFETLCCFHCQALHNDTPKTTFLGFRQFTCLACGQSNKLPLANKTRIFYWVLVGLSGCISLMTLLKGQITLPGLLVIAVAWGLIADARLQNQAKKARASTSPNMTSSNRDSPSGPLPLP